MTNPQLAGLTALEKENLQVLMETVDPSTRRRIRKFIKSLSACRALLSGVEEAYDKKWLNHWFRTNRDAIAAELEGTGEK